MALAVTGDQIAGWVGNPTGQSDSQIGQDIYNGIAAGGASPSELAALSGDQIQGSGIWGSGPGEYAQWANQVNAAEMQAPSSSPGGSTAPAFQPTPSSVAAFAPPPLQSFGSLPQVTPTYATAPTAPNPSLVDPNQNLAYMQQYEGAVAAGLQPTFQQQQEQLNESLASRGITNSGSAQELQNNLYGQQAATLASAEAPVISQGYGYTQQDIQGNQTAVNAFLAQGYSYQQAVALANQQAGNAATSTNAGYYDQALTGNAASYDQYLNQLLGYGANTYGSELGAYTGSYVPNSGVTSTIGTGLSGTLGTYGNIYGSTIAGQGQAVGGLGQAAGAYFGTQAAAGGG